MTKEKDPKLDPELDPDPYLWLMDPDPGGPKTCGVPDPDPILALAVQAVYNWTRTRIGTGSRLVVWGHSLGTAVSSHLGIVQHILRSHQYWKAVLFRIRICVRIRVGTGFHGVCGSISESGFAIRIQIQEGKNDPQS
jgi:hypothetical protein